MPAPATWSVSRVKPARSLYQITAWIISTLPRSTSPPITRLGSVRTEIGGKQRAGGGGAERGGGHDRQDRLDGPYPLQVGVGEAAWAVGDPGGEDAGAVNQRHAGCQARAQG